MADWRGKGRIYVNKVGINAQYCLPTVNVQFSEEFFRNEVCPDLDFKRQSAEYQVFGRLREYQEILAYTAGQPSI